MLKPFPIPRVSGLRQRQIDHNMLQAQSTQVMAESFEFDTKSSLRDKTISTKWEKLRKQMLVPAVLSLLVIQNACQMLCMRYSKVVSTTSGKQYLSSTAVVVSEVLKVSACLGILALQHRGRVLAVLYRDVIVNWKDTLLVSVPAFIYMLQNNLLYVAAANLDATTCQITYQLKIITTALFAVAMMGKHLSAVKWMSLCILMVSTICTNT